MEVKSLLIVGLAYLYMYGFVHTDALNVCVFLCVKAINASNKFLIKQYFIIIAQFSNGKFVKQH